MPERKGYVLIGGTAGGREEAQRIARLLVEQRLAACVQTAPLRSVYRWRGAVEEADEYAFQAKTRRALAAAAVAAIKAVHSYQVPEIIVTPILGGHAPYLEWIEAETAAPRPAHPRTADSARRNRSSRAKVKNKKAKPRRSLPTLTPNP